MVLSALFILSAALFASIAYGLNQRLSEPLPPISGSQDGRTSLVTILDKPAARDLYDRIAGRYDDWLLPFRLLGLNRWRRDLIDALDLAPGDTVRIVDGAFADSAALFAGLADHDRISVLLDLLGRKVRVVLDRDMVAAA